MKYMLTTMNLNLGFHTYGIFGHMLLNMYFHAVKSTAHPPIMGHWADCIVKQSYTFAFLQACCALLKEKLWAEAEAAFTNDQAHWHWKT